jgi:hypothetical protein
VTSYRLVNRYRKFRSTVIPSSLWPISLKAIKPLKGLLQWISRVHVEVHHGAQRNLWQSPWRVVWSRERYHPWSNFFLSSNYSN